MTLATTIPDLLARFTKTNPHKRGTFYCPVSNCLGMRNVDLETYRDHDQYASRREAQEALQELRNSNSSKGEGELRGIVQRVFTHWLCKNHQAESVVNEHAQNFMNELVRLEWVMVTRNSPGHQ
jgi:hypothetical protein